MVKQSIIKWLGHASFQITSQAGKTILIDPWLGGPTCPVKIDDLKQVHLVLITHDHFDHAGDAAELIKNTKAILVANVETANRFKSELGIEAESIVHGGYGMNIGGNARIGDITVTMTQAFHSSMTGSPCGYIIRLEDGKNIYHAGDTGIFSTMAIFGDLYEIDVALLPIGGGFTMDPVQAAKAVELLKPKKVIPMHFQTFPFLEQDTENFEKEIKRRKIKVDIIVLSPGGETVL